MAQVVEALARKSCLPEDRLEPTGHGDPVHRRSHRRPEYDIARVVVPARPGQQALGALAGSVRPKRITYQCWKGDDPAARGRLRLDEDENSIDPLERMADGQRRCFQVDVAPGEAEDLALPKTNAERDEIQGLESVAPDRVEETPSFLR